MYIGLTIYTLYLKVECKKAQPKEVMAQQQIPRQGNYSIAGEENVI